MVMIFFLRSSVAACFSSSADSVSGIPFRVATRVESDSHAGPCCHSSEDFQSLKDIPLVGKSAGFSLVLT